MHLRFEPQMFIDTHSHIYLPQFDQDSEAMLERARQAGVDKILLPNINLESIPQMLALCKAHPTMCYAMMGLHPCDVKENYEAVLETIKKELHLNNYLAIGEIGIDLYWDKTTLAIQIEAFKTQINWAKELSLPIVIHARDSFNEIFEVLDQLHDDKLKGVFHCFTGNLEQAEKIMNYTGFMMGIGGVITYEKSGLDQVVKEIPLQYLILETDSPYLAPKPHRGKRNESAYVKLVAEKVASVKELTLEEVALATTENANKLFFPS